MPGGRRISREAVLAKARRAFAGGRTPTMDDLAARTGVSRAALYQMFGSRRALVEAAGGREPPTSRERTVAAAAELLADRGLGGVSLDEVAARARASRATVYRLFPGKAALLREVQRAYLPMEEGTQLLQAMWGRPPAEVMPAVAATMARAGHVRIGVLRSLLFEVTRGGVDTEGAMADALAGFGLLAGYVTEQMALRRLRPMPPVLAVESFLGPIVLHLVSHTLVEERLALDVPLDEAVAGFAAAWLRAMAPDPAGEHSN